MLLYLDCFSGLAGDMIVGSLLDAGADWDTFQQRLRGLKLEGYTVALETVDRGGIEAKLFVVQVERGGDHHHHNGHKHHEHRDLPTIIDIIRGSGVSDRVKGDAIRVFENLARAEAKVHGCQMNTVHFHEVGAVDAIVDIVGACLCLEILDIDEIQFPSISVGAGTIQSAHGLLPVPAPATAELLCGYRTVTGGQGELTTPTGAAIATTLGSQVLYTPELTIERIGYGAGTRIDQGRSNVLRSILGRVAIGDGAESDTVSVLRTGIDDMSGEAQGYLAERLFEAGALDVVYIPIYMKKGRPGVMLEVIAPLATTDALCALILRESSSFGVRVEQVRRCRLGRGIVTVQVFDGPVRVKVGTLSGQVVQVRPEYEDCRLRARDSGRTFDQVYRQACDAGWRAVDADHRQGQ